MGRQSFGNTLVRKTSKKLSKFQEVFESDSPKSTCFYKKHESTNEFLCQTLYLAAMKHF